MVRIRNSIISTKNGKGKMMLQSKAVLHIEKNDRVYELSLEQISPLGEVYDVINEMRAFIIQRMNEVAQAEAQKQAQQEAPKEA